MAALLQLVLLLTGLISLTLAAAIQDPNALVERADPDFDSACFHCNSPVAREDAVVAVNAACNYWADLTMFPDDSAPTRKGVGYIYAWGGGSIAMSVQPIWTGRCAVNNFNNYFDDFNRCYYGLMERIDGCNTGGTGHKQGGYHFNWCANVTIHPNPADICSPFPGMAPKSTGNDYVVFPKGVRYTGIEATDEEHKMAKVKALEIESKLAKPASNVAISALPEHDTTESTDPLSNMSTISGLVTQDKAAKWREGIQTCFDGNGYGSCWHISRLEAIKAVRWFCYYNQGYEIDMANQAGQRVLGVEGNYFFEKPSKWVGNYAPPPEMNDIKMAVALDISCQHTWNYHVLDYQTCEDGFLSVVDSCNKKSETKKQGGQYASGCLIFEIFVLPCKVILEYSPSSV